MAYDNNNIWQRIFGKAWEPLTKKSKGIGGFLLLHDERLAVIDANAQSLLGFGKTPDYDELLSASKHMSDYSEGRGAVTIEFVEENESLTAGFVRLDEARSSLSLKGFPMASQSELFSMMNAERRTDSVIILMEIEGITGSGTERVCCMLSAIGALYKAIPEDAMIAENPTGEIWVYIPGFKSDPLELAENLRRAVETCPLTDEFGGIISHNHSMTATLGVSRTDIAPAYSMHAASFALLNAKSTKTGSAQLFSYEQYEKKKNDYNELVRFSRLVDQNLFLYHFQPIVSARTGDIVAYEALMRTDPSIGMNPLEILELAERYNRLYDIEFATIRNSLSYLSENQSFFENRKLFINAIPSHLLEQKDFDIMRADYGELMEKVVLEMTEQTELDDEMLRYIKDRIKGSNMELAIDDYGTGYSNTSNLVRYAPQVVKIDRSLIMGIDSNPKMQKLVSGVIEYLHSSGMSALAEGVETIDEIRTLINMSIDLLQGFYISRPKPVFVNEIAENIQQEIVAINLEAAGLIKKVYKAKDGETLNMRQLALEKFTDVYIEDGSYTLTGIKDQPVKIPVTISDGAECEIVLKNVMIDCEPDVPVVKLGKGSKARFICEGISHFMNSGIYVPKDSSLRISGMGDLRIDPEAQDCYAIGCTSNEACGDILIDMDGKLELAINGEIGVGIGGGKASSVRITAGQINITCTSGSCTAIGATKGEADVTLNDCGVVINASAANAVLIGSLTDSARVSIENVALDCKGSGNKLCAIGSLSGGNADIMVANAQVNTVMRGKSVINIGTSDAICSCSLECAKFDLYAEGGSVTGVGDSTGGGDVRLTDVEMYITFLTGDGFALGSPKGTLEQIRVIQEIKINE